MSVAIYKKLICYHELHSVCPCCSHKNHALQSKIDQLFVNSWIIYSYV